MCLVGPGPHAWLSKAFFLYFPTHTQSQSFDMKIEYISSCKYVCVYSQNCQDSLITNAPHIVV
jgi:hypothetical protein